MDKDKKPKEEKHSGSEMSFGFEILLFLVVIFIIWILMGGAKKEKQQSPFLTPEPGQVIPVGTYGSSNN
jgi:hypothetical protein